MTPTKKTNGIFGNFFPKGGEGGGAPTLGKNSQKILFFFGQRPLVLQIVLAGYIVDKTVSTAVLLHGMVTGKLSQKLLQ